MDIFFLLLRFYAIYIFAFLLYAHLNVCVYECEFNKLSFFAIVIYM